MDAWRKGISTCSRIEVIQFCVNDDDWQKFRLSLKGVSTEKKLDMLQDWLNDHNCDRRATVQVNNYLGALKRGGQISEKGEVRK